MERTPSFGDWVRRRRKALDLTQVELARQVGCAAGTIKKIEGDQRRPSRQIAQRLADQLDLPPEQRAAFIHAARAELGADRLAPAPPLAVPNASVPSAARTSNLPSPLTALIGRAQDVATVRAQLAGARLLTLTGPGGIGKTSLALQVASDLRDTFSDGICVVALAPVTDPALVIPAIAQALGVQESRVQPVHERLAVHLRTRQLLLVLDNFEQVSPAAPLIADLLGAAPQLRVLVTSREVLRLAGEHEFSVPPLALPDLQRLPSLQELTASEAVRLFITRAQAVQSDFAITDATASAVATICHRLDGLPLAIELAAARIRLLSPRDMLERLSSPLRFLTRGRRDLPARQQTLRATIDWSYHLLDAGEQRLFARLAVFVGGWTLAAAEAVCGDPWPSGAADAATGQDVAPSLSPQLRIAVSVLDGLAGLVEQSLLRPVAAPDGSRRFVMLETIREYAVERLEASGEAERLRGQHAHYYCTLGAVVWPEPGPWHPAQIAVVDRDYDNLWAALAWSQTSAGDPELGLRLTGALRILWIRRGILREAIAAFERALNHPRGVGRTLAHAIARLELGQMRLWTGEYAAARTQYEQSLQLAREVGDQWWYAVAVEHLGYLAREQGDSATAWAQLTESLALFRTLGDASHTAEVLWILAQVAILDEDPARADALLADGRVLEQRENHDLSTIGWTLNALGHAAQLRGAYDDATQLHQESLACFQTFGDQHFGLPWAYHGLGETALGQGRVDEAGRHLAQGLALSQTLGDQASSAWCLAGLGSVAALDEDPERAARLWGTAERLRQAIGCRPAPAARATYERALAVARAQLGDAAFAAAWAVGQALPLEQAIAEARQMAE